MQKCHQVILGIAIECCPACAMVWWPEIELLLLLQINNFALPVKFHFFNMLFPRFVFQSHTILLVQPTKRPEGRTYADYESVNECMEGGCRHCSLNLLFRSCLTYSLTFSVRE